MENKNEENEIKIILGDFNCIMDKMDRYGGNKTHTLWTLFQLFPVKTHCR